MAHLKGADRAHYVQEMFTRIAPRYDLMNRLMTAGQDVRWRREVVRRAALPPGARLLDLGAGTGDLAREAQRRCPTCQVVPADFTEAMMRVGQHQNQGAPLDWTAADGLKLPFPEGSFDAVVSGFLMRNVVDLPGALQEQRRVLKPGGRIVILDTTRPPQNLWAPFINLHMKVVIPALGRLVAGQADAYTYLPESTAEFLSAEALAARLVEASFQGVAFQRLMFGSVAIHWGEREPV